MEVIRNIPHNYYNVISTFSGCGGSSLGYKMAGYKVLWANEFIPAAQECYKVNHPTTFLNIKDIRKVQPEDILKEINYQEVDILDGSPPCASFSMAGKREKLWGKEKKYSDTTQRVDDLFFEYIRIVKGVQPKIFIAENVAGLTMGVAKNILGSNQFDMFNDQKDTILYQLENAGYKVDYMILNAKYFGVPQNRPRLFIIGVRKDLNKKPIFPTRTTEIPFTLKEALVNVNNSKEDINESLTQEKYEAYKYIIKLKPGETGDMYHPKDSWFSLKRLEWDKPPGTVQQSHGSPGFASGTIHPERNGNLTIPELKRVQSFPDDFILTGPFVKKYERIGRSVAPLQMMAISKTIQLKILDKLEDK
jgi:DNA (cytosine-5)-methyltransferase 1